MCDVANAVIHNSSTSTSVSAEGGITDKNKGINGVNVLRQAVGIRVLVGPRFRSGSLMMRHDVDGKTLE